MGASEGAKDLRAFTSVTLPRAERSRFEYSHTTVMLTGCSARFLTVYATQKYREKLQMQGRDEVRWRPGQGTSLATHART